MTRRVTRRAPRPMTALDLTTRKVHLVGNPASGRPPREEIWEVCSRDGLWRYRREDLPGTPWALERWSPAQKRYVEVYSGFRSLPEMRRSTEDAGWVEWVLERAKPVLLAS